MLSLHGTDAIPPQYWRYPPQYWKAFAVPMLSPTVLNSFRSTEAIPRGTEQPPQYWTDVIQGDLIESKFLIAGN